MVSTVQPTTFNPHHQHKDSSSKERHNDDNDRENYSSDSDEQSSGGDTCSVRSEKENINDKALILRGEDVPGLTCTNGTTFGTVEVSNSNDVHFGNKTYYQGPVTIKQILYAGQHDNKIIGQDDLTVDGIIISNGTGFKKDNGDAGEERDVNGGIQNSGLENTNKFTQKCNQWLPNACRNRVLIIGGATMTLVVLLTLTAVLMVKNMSVTNDSGIFPIDSNEQETGTPIDGPNVNTTLPSKLKVVSRLEWVAQPPTEPANALPVPVPYAILMHTATENCTDQPACVFHVRFIQSYHMDSRGWWDIGYNFLVGGDGNAYEGRGWKSEGAHTYGYNSRSIGIAFIGTFNRYMPLNRQIVACKQLLQKGVELGYLKKDYKLLAARQLSTTQSPGDRLFEDIKTWPNWSENP